MGCVQPDVLGEMPTLWQLPQSFPQLTIHLELSGAMGNYSMPDTL
jgi:hypothetical protein